MSYTDPEEPVPPTVVGRAVDVVVRERDFLIDTLLLIIVTIALGTAYGIWPFVGLIALMLHVLTTKGPKRR